MKIVYKDDTKRFTDFVDYLDLINEAQRSFGVKLSDFYQKIYKFYYIDQEGDVISITSQNDYKEALAQAVDTSKLKLILTDSYQMANQALNIVSDLSSIADARSSVVAGYQTERTLLKGPELIQQDLEKDKDFDCEIFNTTTVSEKCENSSENQKIECFRCDGTKFNKKGKTCKKCRGTGFFETSFQGDLQALIQDEVSKIVNSEAFKKSMTERVQNAKTTHKGYTCNGCKVSPIKGIRYRCSKREDYDLCEICEAKMAPELPYPMWKIREPKHMALSIMCEYGSKNQVQLEQKVVADKKNSENLKESVVPATEFEKIKYMQQLEDMELTPEMKEKMAQLMNMGLMDFNSNLIALFEASGLMDVACSQLMKKNEGVEE